MGAFTMRCFLSLMLPAMVLAACTASLAQGPTYRLGRTPTAEEVRSWDIASGPSGRELPPGSGTAKDGAMLYAQKCAVCHGPTGAEGPAKPLVGGEGTLKSPRPVKTVGSYWPFATTIWDYINRAMPPRQEGTLSADEVYALTAFLLFQSSIIQESDVMDAGSLPKVQMPNRNGFTPLPLPVYQPGEKRPHGLYQ